MNQLMKALLLGVCLGNPLNLYACEPNDPVEPKKSFSYTRTPPRITPVYNPLKTRDSKLLDGDIFSHVQIDELVKAVPLHLHRAAFSVVYFHDPLWFITYAMIGLGIQTHITKALEYAMTPTPEEVLAFYDFMRSLACPAIIFYPKLFSSVQKFAKRLDADSRTASLSSLKIEVLPRNLWAFTNLAALDLTRNNINDVGPLGGLTQLTKLILSENQIEDINPLGGLTLLQTLELSWNRIQVLNPLVGLTQLTTLGLNDNVIEDASPVGCLLQLTKLYLYSNKIVNVEPFAQFTELEELLLNTNEIVDITPLGRLTQLTNLCMYHNRIVDVSPIASLTRLTKLSLYCNEVEDVSPLAGLTQLRDLDMHHNRIVDVSPIASLIMLRELILSENRIENVAPLMKLTQRFNQPIYIMLYGNPVTETKAQRLSIQALFETHVALFLVDEYDENKVQGTQKQGGAPILNID